MSTESRKIARAYPLKVRDIGLIGAELVVARANWDILEVRDLGGRLLLREQVPLENGLLFHPHVHFAGGRYVIAEIGSGITAAGVRVWDFVEQRWVMTVKDHWDDVALVGVDGGRALAALSDGKGVDVFDVARGELRWRLTVLSPASVDFNPAEPELVAAGGDAYLLAREAADAPIAALFARSSLTHERTWPGSPFYGLQLSWLDSEHLVSLSPQGELELSNAELKPLCSLRTDAEPDAALSVALGRWVLLHTDENTTVLDTSTRLPPRTFEGFVRMAPDGAVICADSLGVTTLRL
jgi:hypothetical protein